MQAGARGGALQRRAAVAGRRRAAGQACMAARPGVDAAGRPTCTYTSARPAWLASCSVRVHSTLHALVVTGLGDDWLSVRALHDAGPEVVRRAAPRVAGGGDVRVRSYSATYVQCQCMHLCGRHARKGVSILAS